MAFARHLQRVLAVVRAYNGVASPRQRPFTRYPQELAVLDQQDRLHYTLELLARNPSAIPLRMGISICVKHITSLMFFALVGRPVSPGDTLSKKWTVGV